MIMSAKAKKAASPWYKCEKCDANINQKDTELHTTTCPPSVDDFTHPFVLGGVLHGYLNVKTNEEIKGVSNHDKNNLVFLSQSVIQLCNLVIGEWAVIQVPNQTPVARIVWPTVERSLASVLVTQNDFDLSWNTKLDTKVWVSRINMAAVKSAREITLLALNAPKSLQLSPELILRIKKLHLNRIVTHENKFAVFFYGKHLEFQIKYIIAVETEEIITENSNIVRNLEIEFNNMNITYDNFYKVTNSTVFKLFGNESDITEVSNVIDPFATIGGVDNVKYEIKVLVDLALGKINKIPGTKSTRGILLYGSSGTGKTILANAIAKTSNCNIVAINGTDIYSKYSGETETAIKNLFKEAIDHSPSIILLDEMDILCPLRTSRITDQEKRVVSTLLSQFDELNEITESKICVLATSNRPDYIDPAFRRSGRIEREIEIPIPNPLGRLEILNKLLSRTSHNVSENSLKEIADSSYGFVGSDLESLCSRAAIHAVDRINTNGSIEIEDLKFALTRVRPSAMREVQIEVPNVKWEEIGGQNKLKLILKQAVEWPLKHPESFIRMGITPPRGVLMFGPPGCSKTMIAKALATESGLNFLSIKGPELFSKWVGESERAVREVFRKARQVAPSVVFFDEIDALGGERGGGNSSGGTSVQERVLAQLLTELDGVTPLGDVTVLAATNRPDRIDKALLRPGRLDRIVYVPLPDKDTRKDILRIKLSRMPVKDVDVEYLVDATEKYSGAEIQAVCHEAAMKALEIDINAESVTIEHFNEALNMITPRTPDSLIKIYEEYLKK